MYLCTFMYIVYTFGCICDSPRTSKNLPSLLDPASTLKKNPTSSLPACFPIFPCILHRCWVFMFTKQQKSPAAGGFSIAGNSTCWLQSLLQCLAHQETHNVKPRVKIRGKQGIGNCCYRKIFRSHFLSQKKKDNQTGYSWSRS